MLPMLLMTCSCLVAEPPTLQEVLATTPATQLVQVPDTMDLVTEPTLPQDLDYLDEDEGIGKRLLVYTIAPKQKLTLKMISGDWDRHLVGLAVASPEHPLAAVVKRIMRSPPIVRAQKMELPNTTDVPLQVLVRVTGVTKVPYKVVAKREAL